jgi:hypothetical protein
MKEQKYYWISFQRETLIVEDVTIQHPFIKITKMRNQNSKYGSLLNWKEITKEEYDLFNDILFNIDDPKYNF